MSKKNLTEDEIISYLAKTKIPTILVEGDDDMTVLRWIEQKINVPNINVLPCFGKKTLISIYNRKLEYSNNLVTYLADKDLYVFTEYPSLYKDIIWTKGYSIENDILEYSVKYVIDLFDTEEKEEFEDSLISLIKWYAFEVENYFISDTCTLSFNINQILEEKSSNISEVFKTKRSYHEPTLQMFQMIYDNYLILLRGKSIIELICRFLSHKKRNSKFSKKNILELCLKLTSNLNIANIVSEIELKYK